MYKLGYIKSPKDIRDYKINKMAKVEFPKKFDLKATTILNQGSVNSCVAHSVASVLEYVYHNQYSVGWIYGNRNYGTMKEGMSITDALKTATNFGCVLKKDFDVNEEMPEIYYKVNANRERLEPLAKPYKICAYARLEETEADIKTALMKGLPVIFATVIRSDWLSMNDSYIIKVTDDKIVGGHAMVIYGWNEKGWLIQNSWGETWGNKGTAVLPYEYGIDEAFAISMTPIEAKKPDIVKPNYYWLRELIMQIVKFIKKLIKGVSNGKKVR